MNTKNPSAISPETQPGIGFKILAIAAILFGLLTIKSGASVLFFEDAAREAAGNYVLFVLVFNTIAGVFYIATGVGILLLKRWAGKLAVLLAISTALVFAALGISIFMGNAFETRTVGAMVLRTSFWGVAALVLRRSSVFQ